MITHNRYNVIGICSMDVLADFNSMSYELKQRYGAKNIWFDRDYANRTIIFLTN